MTQEKQREKVVPTREKAVILSSKNNKTTKKNSWVNKDLTKSPKKKRFEQNGAIQSAIKNRTTTNWMEEELSKYLTKDYYYNCLIIIIKKKKKKKRH